MLDLKCPECQTLLALERESDQTVHCIYCGHSFLPFAPVVKAAHAQLSSFFLSASNGEIDDFASKGNIETLQCYEVYWISIRTLFEAREVRTCERRYRGEELPQFPVTEENIVPWEYNLPFDRSFEDQRAEFDVPNSQKTACCSECSARGTLVCRNCRSEGLLVCDHCGGGGRIRCDLCGGTGLVTKTHVSVGNRGSSVGFSQVKCERCAMSGEIACRTCDGRGRVVCSTCEGHGKLLCSHCNGKGHVLTFLRIDQTLTAKEVSRCYWDANCLEKSAKALTPDEFVHFLEKNADSLDLESDGIWGQTVFGVGAIELVREISGRADEESRIVHQNLRIWKSIAFVVTYRSRTRSYEAWLLGEKLRVLAPENPVTDLVRRWMKDAATQWGNGDYLGAAETLSEVWQIGARNTDCTNVIRSARSSMPWGLRPLTLLQYYLDTRGWPWLILWVAAIGLVIGGCVMGAVELLRWTRIE